MSENLALENEWLTTGTVCLHLVLILVLRTMNMSRRT